MTSRPISRDTVGWEQPNNEATRAWDRLCRRYQHHQHRAVRADRTSAGWIDCAAGVDVGDQLVNLIVCSSRS